MYQKPLTTADLKTERFEKIEVPSRKLNQHAGRKLSSYFGEVGKKHTSCNENPYRIRETTELAPLTPKKSFPEQDHADHF